MKKGKGNSSVTPPKADAQYSGKIEANAKNASL